MIGFYQRIRQFITRKEVVKQTIENKNHEATQKWLADLENLENAIESRKTRKAGATSD